jgi:hypothetical protein
VATQFTVASAVQADASITASIDAEGIMTVSAIGSGSLEPGQFITGTDIGPFAYIVSQLSGTAGDTGTYQTTSYNVAASATVVASQGKLGKISTWA